MRCTDYLRVQHHEVLAQQNIIRRGRAMPELEDGAQQQAWIVRVAGYVSDQSMQEHQMHSYQVLVPAAADDFDARFRAVQGVKQQHPGFWEFDVHATPVFVDIVVANDYQRSPVQQ